jgi:hypothetical protein
MKRFAFVLLALMSTIPSIGCSSKLTRREATHQINAAMKPHPVGVKKQTSSAGYVPGFVLASDDREPEFGLYISFGRTDRQPDALEAALVNMRYLAIKDEGPGLIDNGSIGSDGYLPKYRHANSTRLITMTEKAGKPTTSAHDVLYPLGFECYEAPNPTQCNLPALIERVDGGYQITGITQDEAHAKVNILIPWKLTAFAMELKPYARALDTRKPDYMMAEWAKYLNAHAPTGSSPAAILFQKFDDGWRIVDEQGHSEQDAN